MKTSFLRCWSSTRRAARRAGPPSRARRRQAPGLEALEERVTLSLTPQMVLDINTISFSSNPVEMIAVGSIAYFRADDGVHGEELWRSDDSAAGTTLVRDIRPGVDSAHPLKLTNVNGTLFFIANDGVHGEELWRSDGTAASTTLIKDIWPGNINGYPDFLTNVNGTLFFSANDGLHGTELWRSDGTAAGTTLVTDIRPGVSSAYPVKLTDVNGTLFFVANDGTHGYELWRSDGTAAGTTLVKDISPTPSLNGNYLSDVTLTNVNGTLFFTADDGVHGEELWRSDGTAAGTTLVKDIYPGGHTDYFGNYGLNSSNPANLTNVNGTLFFTAGGTNGEELWRSDGTAAGTTLVKDIYPGSGWFYDNYYWVYRPNDSDPSRLTNVNGTLFFSAAAGVHGEELWRSDGTAAGTTLVKDIRPGVGSAYPAWLRNVDGRLYFRSGDFPSGFELWTSDGTAAGTVRVGDINPGRTSSYIAFLTNVNGTLFFTADDGTHGRELWKLVDRAQPTPTLSISDVPVTEGNAGTRAAAFTVTLSAPPAQPATVQYATVNGTATAGSDYQARSGTLTIPAGQTTGTITVLVIGDRLPEPNETFFVNLSAATNAIIVDSQAVGTIVDDEPRISIGDVTMAEGRKNQTTLFTFIVTLSVPYDQPVTMSFGTVNGTATTGDNDYVAKTGTLTFAPGETTKTITVEVKGDIRREPNEYFYLDLSGNSGNSLFKKRRGIGTILNDD
jgi:ELWxxDGT repeat protein